MTISAIPLETTVRDAQDASCEVDRDRDVRDLVQRGQVKAAVCLLMKRYGKAIYRYCRVQLRDPGLAEDVQQEVFLAALRDVPRFVGRGALKSWLFSIAHHRAIDAGRKRCRSPTCVPIAEAMELADLGVPADEACDDARLYAALFAELAVLPDDLRSVILLRFQQGMSFEDIGRALSMKPGTLAARVAREMPKLRERIEARLR
jgi:RNA polymerase sigma factor (sigma-70 family)